MALPSERLRRGRPAYSCSLYAQSSVGTSYDVSMPLPIPKPSIGARFDREQLADRELVDTTADKDLHLAQTPLSKIHNAACMLAKSPLSIRTARMRMPSRASSVRKLHDFMRRHLGVVGIDQKGMLSG